MPAPYTRRPCPRADLPPRIAIRRSPTPLTLFGPATQAWFRGAFGAPTRRPGARLAGHRGRAPHAHPRPDRPRQDARRVPVVPRPAGATEPPPGRPAGGRCASCTSRRSRRSSTTSSATCGRRCTASPWPPRAWACPSRASGSACAPATRRPRSGAAFGKHPPDILVTTPESLYLLLTSQAREALRSVRARDRRRGPRDGRHEARRPPRPVPRAPRRAGRRTPPQRIGLSATQRPLEAIARFLAAAARRPAAPGHRGR